MNAYARATACATGAAALLLSGFTALPAADTTFVQAGDRVRLQAPRISAEQLVGDVTGLEGDTLVLLRDGSTSTLAIPTSGLEQISVSQGRKSNAIFGLLVGAGVGIASTVGLAIWACNADDDGCTSGQVVGGALALTAIGAGLGAGIGALIKTERWQEARMPAPRQASMHASPPLLGLRVGADGSVGLAFSLRL